MKEVITKHELDILDSLAVLAERQGQSLEAVATLPAIVDRIRDMQQALVDVFASVLMVETWWDKNAYKAIQVFVLFGSQQHVESLLKELGIRVDDPMVPHTNHSTQGGE